MIFRLPFRPTDLPPGGPKRSGRPEARPALPMPVRSTPRSARSSGEKQPPLLSRRQRAARLPLPRPGSNAATRSGFLLFHSFGGERTASARRGGRTRKRRSRSLPAQRTASRQKPVAEPETENRASPGRAAHSRGGKEQACQEHCDQADCDPRERKRGRGLFLFAGG